MIDFPLPGRQLGELNGMDLTVVASDYYTDDTAVILAVAKTAPHFVIVNLGLLTGTMVTISDRCDNIGTAVAYYAEWGGTINDIDPRPVEVGL